MAGPHANDIAAMLDELRPVLERVDGASIHALADAVQAADAVFLFGAGRSGLLLRCTAMRLMHLGFRTHIAGDVLAPAMTAGDLLLLASGSGSTSGPVLLAEKARALGGRVALVTASPASPLATLADTLVPIDPGGADHPAHPMGSLFEQAMFLVMEAVVLELRRRRDTPESEMFLRHANLE